MSYVKSVSSAIGRFAAVALIVGTALGGDHYREPNRGDALASPLESPDSPGKHTPASWNCYYMPYYSRTIPISQRWCTERYACYYRGYKIKGKASRDFCPYASASMDMGNYFPGSGTAASGDYGSYSYGPVDEDRLLRLGGDGPSSGAGHDLIGPIPGTP